MKYELLDTKIGSMSLDDAAKEFHIFVNITVGIEGADPRFAINNPNVDFVIKGFAGYDELSEQIKEKSLQWVIDNYPDTV